MSLFSLLYTQQTCSYALKRSAVYEVQQWDIECIKRRLCGIVRTAVTRIFSNILCCLRGCNHFHVMSQLFITLIYILPNSLQLVQLNASEYWGNCRNILQHSRESVTQRHAIVALIQTAHSMVDSGEIVIKARPSFICIVINVVILTGCPT